MAQRNKTELRSPRQTLATLADSVRGKRAHHRALGGHADGDTSDLNVLQAARLLPDSKAFRRIVHGFEMRRATPDLRKRQKAFEKALEKIAPMREALRAIVRQYGVEAPDALPTGPVLAKVPEEITSAIHALTQAERAIETRLRPALSRRGPRTSHAERVLVTEVAAIVGWPTAARTAAAIMRVSKLDEAELGSLIDRLRKFAMPASERADTSDSLRPRVTE